MALAAVLPALTADGDRVAIARGSTVEVYALPGRHLLHTIVHPAAVNAVAFGPAGHDLITGALDGSLKLMRDDSDPIALPRSTAGIDAVAILADGRLLVADSSKRLRVIDRDGDVALMDLVAPSSMRLLRPSQDGTRLVTIPIASEQVPPVLWDLEQYRLVTRLTGHVGRVFSARFVAIGEGTEILTTGSDGTARRWNAASGGLRMTFRDDSHFLAEAAPSPDGSLIVAGGSDGLVRFWDVSSGRLVWRLQAHRSYVIGVHYEGDDLVTRGFAGELARWSLPSPSRIIPGRGVRECPGAAEGKP